MPAQDLLGKTILITAGTPHENVDGIRHYANRARPESHGYSVANNLKERGAKVLMVTPRNALIDPDIDQVIRKINGKDIVSGQDLMNATESVIATTKCDAVLCLASISSIRAAEISDHKIKAKNKPGESAKWTVAKNVDVERTARDWNIPVIGFDAWQHTFTTPNLPGWLSSLEIWHQGKKPWPSFATGTPDWQEALSTKALPKWLAAPAKEEPIEIETPPNEEGREVIKEPLTLSPDHLQNLEGKTVIVTSGPTEEQITKTGDVITNFSTGRQGYEIASILAAAGAKVKYIVGRTNFPDPNHKNVETIHVTSAQSMLDAALTAAKACGHADAYIGVAAVADFRAKNLIDTRREESKTIEIDLDQNPDILETMGKHADHRPILVIGFAAENDRTKLVAYAIGKLTKKNADMICANMAGEKAGHASTENQVFFVMPAGTANKTKVMGTDLLPKSEAGLAIVTMIASLIPRADRNGATPTRSPVPLNT